MFKIGVPITSSSPRQVIQPVMVNVTVKMHVNNSVTNATKSRLVIAEAYHDGN